VEAVKKTVCNHKLRLGREKMRRGGAIWIGQMGENSYSQETGAQEAVEDGGQGQDQYQYHSHSISCLSASFA
jgi:hypothetical protein